MRLGDLDKLLKQMKRRKDYIGRLSDPVCLVEDAPTVDAVPVVYGTWVTDNSTAIGELIERYCSLCYCRTTGLRETWFPYCPNCGAKMELVRTAEGGKR